MRAPGSSPLTRGKPVQRCIEHSLCGLIPAHAGKTGARAITRRPMKAHPRSRGENSDTFCGRGPGMGSSPLTRGKLRCVRLDQQLPGLIPAHAGKTATPRRTKSLRRAHPRSRGENSTLRSPCVTGRGSSPLTRGKHAAMDANPIGLRLIPAHAGKTSYAATIVACFAAHPRSRGENEHRGGWGKLGRGSSPLTRGKRWLR